MKALRNHPQGFFFFPTISPRDEDEWSPRDHFLSSKVAGLVLRIGPHPLVRMEACLHRSFLLELRDSPRIGVLFEVITESSLANASSWQAGRVNDLKRKTGHSHTPLAGAGRFDAQTELMDLVLPVEGDS